MSDYDDTTNEELSELLEKLRRRLAVAGLLHACEDAILIQATRRLSGITFRDAEEIEELKRLVSRHGLTYSQRLQDYIEHPVQFRIFHILGLFSKWFHCQEYTGKPGDGQDGYCKRDAIWLTNPFSGKAITLFRKIATEATGDDDFSSIDGEKALKAYFGMHYAEITAPQFMCDEHIGKLKEIAIRI